MHRRSFRRAVGLSLGALLLFAGTAAADSVLGDADTLTPIVEGSRHLGEVAPGGTVAADVRFVVICAGLQHIDPNQSVVLRGNGGIVPLDGEIVSVSTATLTPLSIPWGADGGGCPAPVPSFPGGALSHVVLRAPTTPGSHTFTVTYARSLSPEGVNDANAFTRSATSVDFTMRVVTPPVLSVPASFSVEGDTTGGWTSAWSVSATDVEDEPDPTPTCVPAAGSLLPLGTTTVTCSVTDSAGFSASKSFDVTVVDTTAPVLHDLPTDITVTTGDPSGRTVDFTTPWASDIVDPSPSVTCAPGTGEHFDVGTTAVTCTAIDARGNPSSETFVVTVVYEPPPPAGHTASAVWLEPVASDDAIFEANRGRTIPIKVRLFVDGQERTTGDASLRLSACGDGTSVDRSLTWSGARWNLSLDTSTLTAACYTVTASIDGLVAGSFSLELRGEEAPKASPRRTLPVASSIDRLSAKGPKNRR